jgi:hypothetical protein
LLFKYNIASDSLRFVNPFNTLPLHLFHILKASIISPLPDLTRFKRVLVVIEFMPKLYTKDTKASN